ncbi:trypsin-like peptidase domain-containing protein [Streptomyces misionensis]|uniref:trypsin-like peptidase domain-containing protein n=1 Tax=Streptomyces misionensis TaxID=67331 RepID=UPI0016443CAD|nr:trypsin-like peptidase domain-containing protein [Streptomyces misionensis]
MTTRIPRSDSTHGRMPHGTGDRASGTGPGDPARTARDGQAPVPVGTGAARDTVVRTHAPLPAVHATGADPLVRIHDLAGRPRGLGFLADHHGTLLTSHEAVAGLDRLVLRAGDRTHVAHADAVTELPERDLALVRTEGLGAPPLPLAAREEAEAGTYVRIAAGCWREARVLAATEVSYGRHLVTALELAIGTAGRDALRPGGGAAGGPVLDARTGAVLGVVGTALRAAPHARTAADRELLSRAARTLLARRADPALHGAAHALLATDPVTRERHLAEALRHFADGDPLIGPTALLPALTSHPEPVLKAFRTRLRGPHREAARCLRRLLADVTTPALARRAATLLREAVRPHPETAGRVAAAIDRRLAGTAAHPALFPLVTGLLEDGPEPLRAALATVLTAPGAPRRELLEILLDREREPSVLDAVLHAAAGGDHEAERDLVHRTGLLLGRTPEGATRFDRALVDLGRHVPGFAARMARRLAEAPDDWDAVVGPSTRRTLEILAGARVPA